MGYATLMLAGALSAALYDADGQRIDPRDADAIDRAWTLLRNADGGSDRWRSVVAIDGSSSCSGALFGPAQVDPQAPAYVLTAGHCALSGLPDANAIVTDADPHGLKVKFDAFVDTEPFGVAVARVSYATMRTVDLAVLELDITVGELLDRGYAPYRLGERPGEALEVVGRPTDGIPGGQRFLRHSACVGGRRASLVEGQFHWEYAFAHRCSLVGGSSGSPVFDVGTGEIVGVAHTTTTGGPSTPPCFLDRPCETGPDGDEPHEEENYAVLIDRLIGCWEQGQFSPAACDLVTDEGALLTERVQVLWNATAPELHATTDHRIAFGDETLDCTDPDAYGPLRPAQEPILLDLAEDPDDRYVLCLLAEDQAPADATVVTWHLDTVAPTARFSEIFARPGGFTVFLDFDFAGGDRVLYRHKRGPADETDCTDPDGYRVHLQLSEFVGIEVPEGERVKFCALAEDRAGNAQLAADATELLLPMDRGEPKNDALDGGDEAAAEGGCRLGTPNLSAWLLLLLLPALQRPRGVQWAGVAGGAGERGAACGCRCREAGPLERRGGNRGGPADE